MGINRIFSHAWSCRIHVYSKRYDDIILCPILSNIRVPCKVVLFSDIRNYNRFNIPQDYAIFQSNWLLPTIKLFLVWFLGSCTHDNASKYSLLVRLYRQGKEINTNKQYIHFLREEGVEPSHQLIVDLKTTALDHSAIRAFEPFNDLLRSIRH